MRQRPLVRMLAVLVLLGLTASGLPADEPFYAAQFFRDPVDLSGICCLHLQNTSPRPLRVTGLELDGQSVGPLFDTDQRWLTPEFRAQAIEVLRPEVLWYRVFPNPVPPGGVCEILVRLGKYALPEQLPVSVELDKTRRLSATLATAGPTWDLDYVAADASLAELRVFVRRAPGGGGLKAIEIDGRPAEVVRTSSFWHDLALAEVRLTPPWQTGQTHTVAAVDEGGRRAAVSLRAVGCPLPPGVFGNVSDSVAEKYRALGFRLHLAFTPPKPDYYALLAKHGLVGARIFSVRTRPDQKKSEPVYYADRTAMDWTITAPSLFAHFLEDEPDGRYHRSSLRQPGICRDVERAHTFCRILDPGHLTFLQIDHGGYPRNLYIFGRIPDLLSCHAYPLAGDIVGKTRDHVRHLRLAVQAKPFYYLCEGYSSRTGPKYVAGQYRLEAYAALAEGAKGLLYYPAHGERGLLASPAAMEAVRQINQEMQYLLPLVSRGTPIPKAAQADAGLTADLVVCGADAAVVTLVNTKYRSSPERFEITPVEKATVRFELPPWMQGAKVYRVTREGPKPLSASHENGRCAVSVGDVADACAVLVRSER